jgi:hypothetical protein
MIHEIHIRGTHQGIWAVWSEHGSSLYAADQLRSLRAWRPLYQWRIVTYYPADLSPTERTPNARV